LFVKFIDVLNIYLHDAVVINLDPRLFKLFLRLLFCPTNETVRSPRRKPS